MDVTKILPSNSDHQSLLTHKNLILIAIGLILFFLAIHFQFTRVIESLFIDDSRKEVVTLLEEKEVSTEKIFVVMSTLKGLTAIIEGSNIGAEAGIGVSGNFNIQVGDVIQSLYDYLDIAWKASMLAMMSIKFQILLLNYFVPENTENILYVFYNFFLSYMFIISLVFSFCKNSVVLLFSRFSMIALGFLGILYILLPLSLLISLKTASSIQTYYEEKHGGELVSTLDEMDTTLKKLKNSIVTYKITESIQGLKNLLNTLPGLAKNWMNKTVMLIVFFIFNNIFFPLFILWFMYLMFKGVLTNLFTKYEITTQTYSPRSTAFIAVVLCVPIIAGFLMA